MNDELKLETFKYFLECYFNASVNYDELTDQIKHFNSFENTEYHQKPRDELNLIEQLNNWEHVQEFVKRYGMRKMNEERLKWLIHSISENLYKINHILLAILLV